jgi:hypothetical protein
MEYRYLDMLPPEWHVPFNRLWYFQSCVALVACVYQGRFLPRPSKPTSIFITQFYTILISMAALYLFEISVTSTITNFPSNAVHHIAAMYIFYEILKEKQVTSVLSILPFVIHSYFWAESAGDDIRLLFLYNLALSTCGMIGLVWNSKTKIASIRLPVLCLVETTVNLFTYCRYYENDFCSNRSGYLVLEVLAIAAFTFTILFLVIHKVVQRMLLIKY